MIRGRFMLERSPTALRPFKGRSSLRGYNKREMTSIDLWQCIVYYNLVTWSHQVTWSHLLTLHNLSTKITIYNTSPLCPLQWGNNILNTNCASMIIVPCVHYSVPLCPLQWGSAGKNTNTTCAGKMLIVGICPLQCVAVSITVRQCGQ